MKPADPRTPSEAPAAEGQGELVCDFCGEPSSSVRRVALDGEYERLRTRHKALYACPSCSEHKERLRLGLERR